MTRYRIVLKSLTVLLGSLILLLAMNGPAAAETDTFAGIAFHPFTLDGGNGTCIPWSDSDIGSTRNCDPVNLVFPDRTWSEVRVLLLGEGWSTSGFGSGQWLHYEGTNQYREDEQLYKSDGSNTRYHIRLWQAPGSPLVTFAAVHHESGFLVHTIDMAWEQAEFLVGEQLCAPNCGQTGPLGSQIFIQGGDSEWRGWANDGSATIIPGPAPTDLPPTVTIINPADASMVSALVPVQIQATDDNDPVGTLVVEWNIDGGTWQSTSYNTSSGYYEASWDSTSAADGDHIINVRATDGASNTTGATIHIEVDNINDPPQAVFTYNCTALNCSFDASGSNDPDGVVVSYDWDFGDGTSDGGVTAGHTFGSSGTYSVLLTVTDDDGSTGAGSQNVTVQAAAPGTLHVGDLEGTSANIKKNWQAQVTVSVHDAGEGAVSDALVTGEWSGDASGTRSCMTDSSGTCAVLSEIMPKKGTETAIFAITSITHADLPYKSSDNHDPDGNSGGAPLWAIQVNKDGTTQNPGQLPNQPPLASFSYSCSDLACTFDASSSTDPDGEVIDFAWDFGDGVLGSGPLTSHEFSGDGVYTVILTITDDSGDSAQDQQDVSIGQAGNSLVLTASGFKVKGVHHAELGWSGTTSPTIDIFRDGGYLGSWPSAGGSYTDNIGLKGGGSYLYQICNAGTAICSNEAVVEF